MIEKKIALISDCHGNSLALKEVIKDIKSRGIDMILNLGDSLYGPLDPQGTFKLLHENEVLSVCGNGDRIILESLDSVSDNKTMEYVKSQIDRETIDWLKSLPFDFVYRPIYCCHASPDEDTRYLMESLETNYIAIKENEAIDDLLKGVRQEIVACGHSHLPRILKTAKKTILNPGSVGLPAYDDDLPIPHKMETFSPDANYSVLSFSENPAKIEMVAIPYDYEAAARLAVENGRDDWARWIRTGRA